MLGSSTNHLDGLCGVIPWKLPPRSFSPRKRPSSDPGSVGGGVVGRFVVAKIVEKGTAWDCPTCS